MSHFEDYTITFINGAELETIKSDWLNLLKQISSPSFIHDFRWFKSRIDSYKKESQESYFILVSYQNSPIAIYPLEYTVTRQFGLNLKTWRIFWINDMGVSDFVFDPDKNPNALYLLVKFLRAQKNYPWHFLFLHSAPQSSNISRLINNTPLPLSISYYDHDSKYLVCKSTYEDSVSGISGKFKRNNRRKLNKL